MDTSTQHLELLFMSSTVTPAMGVGWVFTVTLALPPTPVRLVPAPVVVRLAVVR